MFISLHNQKWEKSYGCNIKHDALLSKSLKHFSIILFLLQKVTKKILKVLKGNKKNYSPKL